MFSLKKFPRSCHELSFQETRDLAWSMANPDICFNVSKCVVVQGALDYEVLTAAIEEVMSCHEALRTSFLPLGPREFKRMLREHYSFELETLAHHSLAAGDEAVATAVRRFTEERFEVDAFPQFRVLAVRTEGPATVLAISMAHAISDAASADIFLSDIGKAYVAIANGARNTLRPPDYTLSDFVQSHREWMTSEDYLGKLQNLQQRLGPGLEGAHSTVDACSVSQQKARKAAVTRNRLPDALYAKLDKIAKGHRVTAPAALLAVTALSLSRLTGKKRLYFSHMLSNRHYPGMAGIIGHLANATPVYVDLQDGDVGGLLSSVNKAFYLSASGAGMVPLGAVNAAVAGLDPILSLKSPFNQLMVNIPAPFQPMASFAGMHTEGYRNPYAGFISNALQINYAYGPDVLMQNCRCPEEDVQELGQRALDALSSAIEYANGPADSALSAYHGGSQ